MKKILALAALMAVSTASFGQAASGIANIASGTQLDDSACAAGVIQANERFTITLSQAVVGSYDCSTTTVGVATAHPTGRGFVYATTSAGGRVQPVADDGSPTTTANKFTDSDAAQTATATRASAVVTQAGAGAGTGGAGTAN